jgi:hypothetical protein
MIDRPVMMARWYDLGSLQYLYFRSPCSVSLEEPSGRKRDVGHFIVRFHLDRGAWRDLERFSWMKLKDVVDMIRFHIQRSVVDSYGEFGFHFRYERYLLFLKFRQVRLNKDSDLKIVKHDVSSLVLKKWGLFRIYSYYRQSVAGSNRAYSKGWL